MKYMKLLKNILKEKKRENIQVENIKKLRNKEKKIQNGWKKYFK